MENLSGWQKHKKWIIRGVLIGVFFFLLVEVVIPYVMGTKPHKESLFIMSLIWLIGGLGLSLFLNLSNQGFEKK